LKDEIGREVQGEKAVEHIRPERPRR
jgi:hypothetical protein